MAIHNPYQSNEWLSWARQVKPWLWVGLSVTVEVEVDDEFFIGVCITCGSVQRG